MAEVVFETDRQLVAQRASRTRPASSVSLLLMKSGLVKTDKGAQFLLVGIALACIVIMGVIWGSRGGNDASYGNHESFMEAHPEIILE